MKAKTCIISLGRRFYIESPHVRHVADLALDLFDGFSPSHGLSRNDRKLLFAAAYLHDIAYSCDPQNHVIEGARILAEHPLDEFTPAEWRSVIGVVLLHKRDWRAMLDHEAFPQLPEQQLERTKKLAAILRIADGLDHGHIQDVRIISCRSGRKADKIAIECEWYEGNLAWAEGKADLWEAVFKRGIRIKGKLKRRKKMFKGIVHKKDAAVAAARRLLYSQWCIMRDNVPGMLEGNNLECLHDYRVAMRRFRAALRMFKPLLNESNAHVLDQQLAEFSNRLSPVRDAHVALQLFQTLELEKDPNPEILRSLQKDVADANAALAGILSSDLCLQTVQMASSFLRVELPLAERDQPEPLFQEFAQMRLESLMGRIRALDVSALREDDPAHMHHVRKLCRRGRYYAEFASPVLEKEVQRTAKHLRSIAVALGEVRDARALSGQYGHLGISGFTGKCENSAWKRFAASWAQLADE